MALITLQALRSHDIDLTIPTPEQFADLAEDEKFNEEFLPLSYWTPLKVHLVLKVCWLVASILNVP